MEIPDFLDCHSWKVKSFSYRDTCKHLLIVALFTVVRIQLKYQSRGKQMKEIWYILSQLGFLLTWSKRMTKSNLGGKGIVHLIPLGNSSSLRKVGQELQQKPQKNASYWLVSMAYSAWFAMNPRSTGPRCHYQNTLCPIKNAPPTWLYLNLMEVLS